MQLLSLSLPRTVTDASFSCLLTWKCVILSVTPTWPLRWGIAALITWFNTGPSSSGMAGHRVTNRAALPVCPCSLIYWPHSLMGVVIKRNFKHLEVDISHQTTTRHGWLFLVWQRTNLIKKQLCANTLYFIRESLSLRCKISSLKTQTPNIYAIKKEILFVCLD